MMVSFAKNWSMLAVLLLVVMAATQAGADKIYVRAEAPAGGNGNSWTRAYNNTQDAIDAASPIYSECFSPQDQIWVKKGTYGLTAPILLDKVVPLYGGFDGTETVLSRRDPAANQTYIIGGDTVRCMYITEYCRVDGFRFINGYIDGDGETTLKDWMILGSAWGTTTGDSDFKDICDLASPRDGVIDLNGAAVFLDGWLCGAKP